MANCRHVAGASNTENISFYRSQKLVLKLCLYGYNENAFEDHCLPMVEVNQCSVLYLSSTGLL